MHACASASDRILKPGFATNSSEMLVPRTNSLTGLSNVAVARVKEALHGEVAVEVA